MTNRKTARFTVRPDGIDPAIEAIETFVAHTRTEPGTIRYESWRSMERPGARYPLCDQRPVFEDRGLVGPDRG